MARLDVSDVLEDPDFMDYGIIGIHFTQTIGDDGEAVNTETRFLFDACVQSGTGSNAIRMPEGELVSADLALYTRAPLSAGAGNDPADELIWKGRRYIVKHVADWSNYGTGYTMVTCDLKPLKG